MDDWSRFFSSRDLTGINMLPADAVTGKVKSKIASTGRAVALQCAKLPLFGRHLVA